MRNIKSYLLILAFSCLPFITIFLTPTLPHTSDGGVQIPRMAAFYIALRDGHFPVRWAGDLNYGDGLPLFNFIYHTPFYISSLFIGLGVGLIPTFKIVLALSFVLSGLFMYLFAKEFFEDEKTALLVTILYQFAPYRLIEILVRGSVGGIYAYAFLPLTLWAIIRTWKNPTAKNASLIAIASGLIILSHNALALLFFGCIGLFVLLILNRHFLNSHPNENRDPSVQSLNLRKSRKTPTMDPLFRGDDEKENNSTHMKRLIFSFFGLLGGLGLSAYYWIPALVEHRYTYGDLFMKDLYKVNFPLFINFFIPNPLDSARLRISEIAVNFGIMQTVVIFLTLFFVIKFVIKNVISHSRIRGNPSLQLGKLRYLGKPSIMDPRFRGDDKKIIPLLLYSIFLIVICLFFMHPISIPIWERISFLRQFQFPWRFLGVITLATSFLGVTFFQFQWIKKSIIYWGIIAITVFSTAFYWHPTQGYDVNAKDEDFWNYPLNTTYFGETDVVWSAGPAKGFPNSRIEVIDGNATIHNFKKITHIQTFTTESTTGAKLVSHTQYFPGWRVYVNATKAPIEFQDQNWRGLITFPVSKGTNNVKIIFEESPIRQIADGISLISLLGLGGLLLQSIYASKKI